MISELDFQRTNSTVMIQEIISNISLGETSLDTVFELNLNLLNSCYFCIFLFCFSVWLVDKV